MKLKLVEPLRELFKDEVRALGRRVGLPREMVYRHRSRARASACASSAKFARTTPTFCARPIAIFIEELRRHDLYDKTSTQAFAVFLPVRSVGSGMGDGRRYDYVVALRAVGNRRLHDRALGAAALRLPRRLPRVASSTR